MKAAQITPGKKVMIETRTDAKRVINSQWTLEQWLNEYGNLDVEYDQKYNVYRVPALQEAIQSFSAAKMRACERFGCE